MNKKGIIYKITLTEASEKLGINKSNISSCCKMKRKTAGGFIFRYKDGN